MSAFLKEQLEKNGADNYNVEFKVFQTNHVAHGIIALYQLGASEEKILSWTQEYLSKGIEKAEGDVPTSSIHFLPGAPEFEFSSSFDELIGLRIHFGPVLYHYRQRLEDCGGSLDKLLREDFPKLVQGFGSHLQHPIIQLGYGVYMNNTQIALEGMAYLHTSYFKPELKKEEMEKPFGEGKESIFSVLSDLSKNKALRDEVDTAEKSDESWRYQGGYGNTQRFLFEERAEQLNAYINRIEVPADACGPKPDVKVLKNFILETMLKVFVATEPKNDFVILHCVTGAWALREILEKLDDPVLTIVGARVMLITLLFSYLRQKCHPLHEEYLTPKPDLGTIAALQKKALEFSGYKDEHFYKMIQVCRDFARSSAPSEDLCRIAADIVINNPEFHFGF